MPKGSRGGRRGLALGSGANQELTGSEKQVAWAKDIRAEAVSNYNKLNNSQWIKGGASATNNEFDAVGAQNRVSFLSSDSPAGYELENRIADSNKQIYRNSNYRNEYRSLKTSEEKSLYKASHKKERQAIKNAQQKNAENMRRNFLKSAKKAIESHKEASWWIDHR